MNKTYNINLGGMPFQVDDVAFDKLNTYLDAVRSRFSYTQGSEEIMGDIEARMAEMFQNRLKSSNRQIITVADVDQAIDTMGKPEDFDEEMEEDYVESVNQGRTSGGYRTGKKLYRDPDNRIFGGVISGLSHYFGLSSPTPLRILWAALPVADFFGLMGISTTLVILTYVVLWIAIPLAKTPIEKMQMRGEPINLDNIQRNVSDQYQNVKKNFDNESIRQGASKAGSFLENFIQGLGRVLLFFGLIMAIMALAGLIVGFFILFFGLIGGSSFISNYLIGNGWTTWLGFFGIVMTSIALPIFLIALFIKLLFNTNINMPAVAIGTLGSFILGIILTSLTTMGVVRDFTVSNNVKSIEQLDFNPKEVTVFGNEIDKDGIPSNDFFDFFDELDLRDEVDLVILPSVDSVLNLTIEKSARGRNSEIAKHRAENIQYEYNYENHVLTMNDQLQLEGKNKVFRDQQVESILRVPINTVLIFDNSAYSVLQSANVGGKRYYANELVEGGRWKMEKDRLVNIDENGEEIIPTVPEEDSDADWSWDDEDFSDLSLDDFKAGNVLEWVFNDKRVGSVRLVESYSNLKPKIIRIQFGDKGASFEAELNENGEVVEIKRR